MKSKSLQDLISSLNLTIPDRVWSGAPLPGPYFFEFEGRMIFRLDSVMLCGGLSGEYQSDDSDTAIGPCPMVA